MHTSAVSRLIAIYAALRHHATSNTEIRLLHVLIRPLHRGIRRDRTVKIELGLAKTARFGKRVGRSGRILARACVTLNFSCCTFEPVIPSVVCWARERRIMAES